VQRRESARARRKISSANSFAINRHGANRLSIRANLFAGYALTVFRGRALQNGEVRPLTTSDAAGVSYYRLMIPLSDDNPTRSFPIITILLIALNIAVYVLQVTSGWQFDGCYEMVPYKISTGHDIVGLLSITRMGNLVLHHVPDSPLFSPQGNQIYLGPSPHPLWLTIFTAMFMHSGLLHIGGNMLYLWIFGNNIEDVLGKVRFLFFYLVCGVVAALTQIAADPLSYIPTLGASGAIAGVLGAYLVLFPGARVNTFVPLIFVWIIRLPAFLLLGFWFALQYMSAQDAAGAPSMGGVAYFAHVGGFIAGVVIIAVLGGRSLIRPRRTLYRGGR